MSAASLYRNGVSSGDATPAVASEGTDLVLQMAHDLRSPLSSILVLAEALQSGQAGPVTDAQRSQLGLIYSAALSLCSAATDMIDMARAGETVVQERPAPFSVSEVLRSVRAMVQPMVDERKLELRLVGPELDWRVGRARTLSRVLLNLTTNALKSTERGFVEIALREVSGSPLRVECSVLDTGRGLEPAVLRSLFGHPAGSKADLQQQLTSAGIGLATCRKLVSAMGSTLGVETRARQGTRFSFEIGLPPLAMLD